MAIPSERKSSLDYASPNEQSAHQNDISAAVVIAGLGTLPVVLGAYVFYSALHDDQNSIDRSHDIYQAVAFVVIGVVVWLVAFALWKVRPGR